MPRVTVHLLDGGYANALRSDQSYEFWPGDAVLVSPENTRRRRYVGG